MAKLVAKRPMLWRKKSTGSVGKRRLLPKQYPIQEGVKGKKYEPESSHILHAIKDKHQLARTIESNKHGDNRNGVKARKKQIQMEWSMHKGPWNLLLVPSQYMKGGPLVKAFRGCCLVVGRKRGLLWGSRSSFFRKNVQLGWHFT